MCAHGIGHGSWKQAEARPLCVRLLSHVDIFIWHHAGLVRESLTEKLERSGDAQAGHDEEQGCRHATIGSSVNGEWGWGWVWVSGCLGVRASVRLSVCLCAVTLSVFLCVYASMFL